MAGSVTNDLPSEFSPEPPRASRRSPDVSPVKLVDDTWSLLLVCDYPRSSLPGGGVLYVRIDSI